MNPEEIALWNRINDFQFDEKSARFPFSLKVAKEYNWDIQFTAEAILEYKKYAFLSCILKNTSPPVIIDKVWHIHLLYTKQYWHVWCKDILQKELHHNPASGGILEKQELMKASEDTKSKYQECFGIKPLKKYWS